MNDIFSKGKLDGIIAVMNTPFNECNTIDEISIRNYIRDAIESGAVGVLALGMAAEVEKLTIEEKTIIINIAVDEISERIPLLCNISSSGVIQEELLLMKKFHDLGCDGFMVNIPYSNQTDYLHHVSYLDSVCPSFLMIQDWDFDGYGLPVDLIVKLYNEYESFKSLKIEVVPAGVKYSKVISTIDKLHVCGGWAGAQMIEALDRGVNAFMPTPLISVYVEIFNLYKMGFRKQSIELFNKLIPILAFSHQHLDISIHFNKKLNYDLGLFCTDYVRQPILDFDHCHNKLTDGLIQHARSLISRKW